LHAPRQNKFRTRIAENHRKGSHCSVTNCGNESCSCDSEKQPKFIAHFGGSANYLIFGPVRYSEERRCGILGGEDKEQG